MRNFLVPFAAVVLLAGLARPGVRAQEPAPKPSFHSASTELVVLPVTVTDTKGRFISDLARDRFTVYDNDRRQEMALFTNEDTPVTVGLVVDNSGSMRPKVGEVVAASLAFARISNPQDELFTLEFSDDVQDANPGRQLLADDVESLRTSLTASLPDGRTALYDALIAGLDRVNAGNRARRVLILISDGGDNASTATLAEVLARARASNVTIYTIGLFDSDDRDSNPRVLKSIAQTTGGERFLPASPGPLLTACERIAREIRSGYTIGYAPPDRDGRYHRVRVEVARGDGPKMITRTRPGYFAAAGPVPQ
ncbi:MAG TPA: VWA domain-containing protein [Vicinamibacterales bacterium]|jgi:VWFA-related protein|nr:VWA domain-containing protein [Vicinamibacterales bacterium]